MGILFHFKAISTINFRKKENDLTPCSKSVVLKLYCASEAPGLLRKAELIGLIPRDPDMLNLEEAFMICILMTFQVYEFPVATVTKALLSGLKQC